MCWSDEARVCPKSAMAVIGDYRREGRGGGGRGGRGGGGDKVRGEAEGG